MTVIEDWDGIGQRTAASIMTEFKDVLIVPNEVTSLSTWSEERMFVFTAAQLVHAAIDVGTAAAVWEDAIDYGRNKARPVADSGGVRVADDPYAMHTVGEMSVLLHTGKAMLMRADDTLDHAAEAQLSGNLSGNELEGVLVEASIAVAEAKAGTNAVSLRLCEQIYVIAGAAMNLRHLNYDRHWRNARTHTLHDPAVYRYKAIGDYYFKEKLPMITTKL